jgi:hypothetical protein
MTAKQRHARLGRYFWWQFHDYMLHQAPATAAVLTMYAYLTLMPILNGSLTNGRVFKVSTLPMTVVQGFFSDSLASFILLGTLFATNGIVATDRKTGFYRFYFAKPVSAARFYTNAFIAHGTGMLTVSLLLLAAFSLFVRPVLPLSFPVVTRCMSYGGVGFMLTIWRLTGCHLLGTVSSLGWGMWGEDQIRGWWFFSNDARAGPLRVLAGALVCDAMDDNAVKDRIRRICFLIGI